MGKVNTHKYNISKLKTVGLERFLDTLPDHRNVTIFMVNGKNTIGLAMSFTRARTQNNNFRYIRYIFNVTLKVHLVVHH